MSNILRRQDSVIVTALGDFHGWQGRVVIRRPKSNYVALTIPNHPWSRPGVVWWFHWREVKKARS